jgi:hypothetical protein
MVDGSVLVVYQGAFLAAFGDLRFGGGVGCVPQDGDGLGHECERDAPLNGLFDPVLRAVGRDRPRQAQTCVSRAELVDPSASTNNVSVSLRSPSLSPRPPARRGAVLIAGPQFLSLIRWHSLGYLPR